MLFHPDFPRDPRKFEADYAEISAGLAARFRTGIDDAIAAVKAAPTATLARLLRSFLVASALAASAVAAAPKLIVERLDGPVTAREVAAFKAYLDAQPLPTDNLHNAMVYGPAGASVEALGTMYELTRDRALLDRMLAFTDAMLAARNDPQTGRVLWTGARELVWPNAPASGPGAAYSGTENGDVVGHIAYAAELILATPGLAAEVVGSGDPHGFGATYGARARRYVAELDRTMDTFIVKWLVDPRTLLYRWPTTPRYGTLGERAERSRGKGVPWNQQMMLNNGFQRLAECHARLGDDPARVARYDAIVKASVDAFFRHLTRYTADGVACYIWSYAVDDPALKYVEDVAHGGYDMLVFRAYASGRYGITRAMMQPFANTFRHVIVRGPGQFARRVNGTGGVRADVGSAWLLLAEFEPQIYDLIGTAALRRPLKPDLVARLLALKQQRWERRVRTGSGRSMPIRVGHRSAVDRHRSA